LEALRHDADQAVRREAERNLRSRRAPVGRPAATTVNDLADDHTPGDPQAGRRVFFRAAGGRCSVCHVYDGRGGNVGPELTTIRRRADRRWLLETILDPNRDVAPRFAAMTVVTADGRTFTGQAMPGPGDDAMETLMQTDGTPITFPIGDIVERHYSNRTIMPEGLGEVLGADELRDLIAFLLAAPE
jgi:putative heme-binding domain-containing protein